MTDSQTNPPQEPMPGTDHGPAQSPVLDEGTYTGIREPRGAGRLALDGHWHQISPRYVVSQLVQNLVFIAVVAVAAGVLSAIIGEMWVWIPAGVVILITLLTLAILPRQAKAIGYMLRADDIVFRKGILWQRMIAVPYGRMQLVDINRGPIARAFGLSELKLVTAAASSHITIPGLPEADAETLRDRLVELAESRRAGL